MNDEKQHLKDAIQRLRDSMCGTGECPALDGSRTVIPADWYVLKQPDGIETVATYSAKVNTVEENGKYAARVHVSNTNFQPNSNEA